MKLLESLKSMFTNKEEIKEAKYKAVDTNIIYMNDRMLYQDKEGSMLWLVTFKHDDYVEFLQIAETFPFRRWKIYPFQHETIVLVNLSISDIQYIFKNCRFTNNPFMLKLSQDVAASIPKEYAQVIGKDFEDIPYLRETLHDHFVIFNHAELEDDDEDFKEIDWNDISYLSDMKCETAKILSYDNIEELIKHIVFAIPQLTPYIVSYDIVDLARVRFILTPKEGMPCEKTWSYRKFVEHLNCIYNEYKTNKDFSKSPYDECYIDLYYLLKDSNKIDLSIVNEIQVPPGLHVKGLDYENQYNEEPIDETISDEIITNTSQVPEENWIIDNSNLNQYKGEDKNG